jgi:hypothetical protein
VNALAGLLVRLAVRVLPGAAARRRYAAEFAAELHGRPAAARLWFALGILSTVFALRAAQAGAPIDRAARAAVRRARWQRFRCTVLRLHHWKVLSNPDGERYLGCAWCGHEHSRLGPVGAPGFIGTRGGI